MTASSRLQQVAVMLTRGQESFFVLPRLPAGCGYVDPGVRRAGGGRAKLPAGRFRHGHPGKRDGDEKRRQGKDRQPLGRSQKSQIEVMNKTTIMNEKPPG